MGAFYSTIGQNLQSGITGGTIFWSLTILLVILVITVIFVGAKKLFNPGRLKWLLLHTVSVFIVGYSLKNFVINKYLEVIIFAVAITLLSKLYRYLMFKEKPEYKDLLKWLCINLGTFYLLMILFEVVGLTDNLLKTLYSGICLTLAGAMFSNRQQRNNKDRHNRRGRRRH